MAKKRNNHQKWTKVLAGGIAFLASFLITVLCFSSCADHDDMYDAGIKVGNILLADNTIVSPGKFDAGSMKAVGVVFFARGDTAIAVAPDELGDFCFTDSIGSVSGVSKDSYSINGLTSTAALLVSSQNSPAARACVEYYSAISGWYLPSAGELRRLAQNLCAVAASMKVIEGTPFDEVQYLSSSEDNSSSSSAVVNCYCVSLQRGYAVSVSKKERHRVRPVILVH